MKHQSLLLTLVAVLFTAAPSFAQTQACPANINFATGDLSFWSAGTGLVKGASASYPAPNSGVSTIPEYSISTTGIQVITTPTADPYGAFATIPIINGYSYDYAVKIGSTATSHNLQSAGSNPGGFTRSITYTINVPAGSTSVPYTMTYAYAMVLENGTHNSNEQPLFKATLSTKDSIISCASPKYYLPTFNNSGNSGSGATLDTATAIANGFTNSPTPFLSYAGNANNAGTWLYDVWTKGWTEVTFDLSAYRGQQVSLTFEADNCTPGAHFAYAYVALRNKCAGLQISGSPNACANSTMTYSIPSLANGVYNWQVPPGWTILSGANTNTIQVMVGSNSGNIIAQEINGCANLRDTLLVTTKPPTVAGAVISDNTVCSGSNNTSLSLTGQVGGVLKWLYSTDGSNWNVINNTSSNYQASNLTATTRYKAIVQNGNGCTIDSSAAAIITVDAKSKGGMISPGNLVFCAGQNSNSLLTLSGNTGSVVNWQLSGDGINWNDLSPANTASSFNVNSITATTYYRTIVKNGVCPADTSAKATISFNSTPFPSAAITPDSSTICYGASANFSATINTGTSYSWTPINTLHNWGNGTIPTTPYTISPIASPLQSTNYVLSVTNAGCPNILRDTFKLIVTPKIIVFAGNDTNVLAGQPLPLHASASDATVNQYLWTPPTGLNATNVYNPVAVLNADMGSYITYVVKATNAIGCTGQDSITIRIFTTGADIFVPDAFTPNGDGRNDVIRPVCVGIKQFKYFRIYNRWGEMVFSTNQMNQGWDGRLKGNDQQTSNFIYMAEGIDFKGNRVFKKGNVVLIR